jgi:hypothetical protein
MISSLNAGVCILLQSENTIPVITFSSWLSPSAMAQMVVMDYRLDSPGLIPIRATFTSSLQCPD